MASTRPSHRRPTQDPAAHLAAALRGRDDPLRIVFDHVQDVIYLIDCRDDDFRYVAVNPAFLRATGLRADDVVGRRVTEVIPPPSIELVMRRYAEALSRRAPVHWEEVTSFPAGTRYGEVMVAPVFDDAGHCTHLVGTVHDVTDDRTAQRALHRLANYDELTGLPNRSCFRALLAAQTERAVEEDGARLLLYLDLDGFKTVNDALGHRLGDALLRQVGERLRDHVRPGDVVGRLGGDEFGVIARVDDLERDAEVLVTRMQGVLRAPFQVDGHEIRVTSSIGIAACPGDSCDADDLLRFAGAAMYHAKSGGRNRHAFYSREMDQRARRRRELETALRRAVERHEFVVHYQPAVQLGSGGIVGFEALVRWNRPGHGLVAPGEFMPVLEDTGLIRDVGEWVISDVVRQLAAWEADGHAGLRVAVNVSAAQLRPSPVRGQHAEDGTNSLLDHVQACLARHPLHTARLELELTESVLMTDAEFARSTLERLRAVVGRVHVDDFGTGYSSLAYLKRLPIDSLKIDRVFVQDLPDDAEDASIVRAVIGMAHSLGLGVIAEGIETAAQRQLLIDAGCDHGQGYLFSRPVPADRIPALLRHGIRFD